MAKRIYIGAGGVARKVKKGYIGVGNAARKLKKAYIGVGGVARPFWAGGEVAYYGTVTPLSSAKSGMGSASAGSCALFAGGYVSGRVTTVSAYNSGLSRSLPTVLSQARNDLQGASVGSYAVFGGGCPGTSGSAVADAYSSDLSKVSVTSLSVARMSLAAVSGKGMALFGGGRHDGSNVSDAVYSTVDGYNESLTRSILPSLQTARRHLSGCAVGKYALFGGGHTVGMNDNANAASAAVDAYDTETLTRTTAASLSTARSKAMGASNGKYGLFCGGGQYATVTASVYTTVDAYDENLTHSNPTALSVARNTGLGSCAASFEGIALIAGGVVNGNWGTSAAVDSYDSALTKKTEQSLSAAKTPQGAVAGDFALFGGGYTGSGATNVVEAYTIA